MSGIRTLCIRLCGPLALAALLLLTWPQPGAAALPKTMETPSFDWVCVTDVSLTAAYAALAARREGQGLSTLVVSLDEVIRWSPAGDDTTATLRWLAGVAHEQWGARYLLLGGSHARLPAPIHRLAMSDWSYDNPTDAYYACLGGDWDVDGDGLVAEWEDDAADPVIHLAVGRIPADDPATVADVVNKIVAFETRPIDRTGGALFVSSLMDRNWDGTGIYPNWALNLSLSLQNLVQASDPDLRIGVIHQGAELLPPEIDPLNEAALVDSLGSRPHDFAFFQLFGLDSAWELVYPRTLHLNAWDPLVDTGHAVLLTMLSGQVADSRQPGVLSRLLTLRSGGAVAAFAPTGMSFITPQSEIQDRFWPHLLDRSHLRLGDAFRAALDDVRTDPGLLHSAFATTYWFQSLQGDPATLIRSLAEQTTPVPVAAGPAHLRAVPNPFNPQTRIAFEVEGNSGILQPVKVEVFDLQGRRIATLMDRALPPGPREITWNPEGGSGLYFVRVTVGSRNETVKLTLIE